MAGTFTDYRSGGGSYIIVAEGLGALDELRNIPDKVQLNAVRAINRTLDRTRTLARRKIQEQVALPASYLNRDDRLGITQRASRGNLQGRITGRHRPTSLARFSRGVGGKRGIIVEVEPGLAKRLPGAFFVNLRAGNTDGGPGNRGLAIRLPEGKRPDRAYKPQPLGRGAWLLYGPSISQVFDDVAVEIRPATLDFMESEFNRLMAAKV